MLVHPARMIVPWAGDRGGVGGCCQAASHRSQPLTTRRKPLTAQFKLQLTAREDRHIALGQQANDFPPYVVSHHPPTSIKLFHGTSGPFHVLPPCPAEWPVCGGEAGPAQDMRPWWWKELGPPVCPASLSIHLCSRLPWLQLHAPECPCGRSPCPCGTGLPLLSSLHKSGL